MSENDVIDESRLVRVAFNAEVIRQFCIQGKRHAFEVIEGVPEDCVIRSVYTEPFYANGRRGPDTIYLILWHETFDPIPEGEVLPLMLPEFRVNFCDPNGETHVRNP